MVERLLLPVKSMRLESSLAALKSLVLAPLYSAISFGTPGMSFKSRKKSASVVVRASYAHCIFKIMRGLPSKLS